MYILEGNIGAGKSTFLRLVHQHLSHIEIVLEPLATWQHPIDGESILANFCHKPDRWAYSFETLTMMCRVKDHLAQQQLSPLRILERSIYSGHYCFAQNGYQQNYMGALEWEMYNQWFNFLVPTKCRPPLGFIYLQTSPQTAYKRIQKRARTEESAFAMSYLEQIHDRHESFLIAKNGVLPELASIPILVLDCNEEFENNPTILKDHLSRIEQFILATLPKGHKHQLQPTQQSL